MRAARRRQAALNRPSYDLMGDIEMLRQQAADGISKGARGVEEGFDYFFGPTGIGPKLNSVNELTNPIIDLHDAGAATSTAFDSTLPADVRRDAAMRAVVNTASAGAPMMAGKLIGAPVKSILSDTLTNVGMPRAESMTDALKRVSFGDNAPLMPKVGDFVADESGSVDIPMLTSAHRAVPADFLGATIKPTVADLTRAGGQYTGINASKIDEPMNMYGGPAYPLLQSSRDANLAWAVDGKSVATKKTNAQPDLFSIHAMNPNSHRSNATVTEAYTKTLAAHARDGRIAPQDMATIDARVRARGSSPDPALQPLSDFVGFADPNVGTWLREASFEARKAVMDVANSAEVGKMDGTPNVEQILDATRASEYAGAGNRDVVGFIQPDWDKGIVDLEEAGLPVHPSYKYGLHGQSAGEFDSFLRPETMYPEFFDSRGEINVGGNRRAFDMSLPMKEITGTDVRRMEDALTAQHVPNLSPVDTRLITNSLNDNWRLSGVKKADGGIAPQQYVDAILDSPYAASLDKMDAKSLNADIKSGKLRAFQLGDDPVYFSLETDPYNAYIPNMEPVDGVPDIGITRVVSNANSSGMAAPAAISKAIEEGATTLTAFAVPSKRAPSGFLPKYYAEFGFEEKGRIPFDEGMFIADNGGGDAGRRALADIKDVWKRDGWDGETMPDVVGMRWSGDNARRTEYASAIRGGRTADAGTGENFSPLGKTSRPAGQQPAATVRSGQVDGRRDIGQPRNDNGTRISDKYRDGIRLLGDLTDKELKNKWVPSGDIPMLRGQ